MMGAVCSREDESKSQKQPRWEGRKENKGEARRAAVPRGEGQPRALGLLTVMYN